MRTIKTTTGASIELDGDLLAIMETLYREVTARRELNRSFEDMTSEIKHLIDQMSDAERRAYLLESLFLNTVRYENDKLEAYMRKISK
ncbi:MAG TPA: hypothetical protein VFU28_21125 [Vicinamibacterales bacterium]|jgi:hypothetical protein|nr:hypothetical protein [Vicinamibacterales bacterium]